MSKKKSKRIIPFKRIEKQLDGEEAGQISISECRQILCKNGAEYTDDEVAIIRRTLYTLAEIDYKYHNNPDKPFTTIIPLNATNDNEQQESHPLLPGKYRRAS